MIKMISIIIPIYNGSQHIDRCLSSVLQQTYNNIEIVLIDDYSTDDTYQKCLTYQQSDNRIKLLRNTENKGVSYSRNIGITNATGKYICFIDADDELYSNHTLQLLYRPEYDLICGNYQLINNEAANNNKFVLCTDVTILDRNEFLQRTYEYLNCPRGTNNLYSDVWAKLHKTSIIKKNNIWFNAHMTKDEVVAFSLEYATYVNHCLIIPDIVYKYYSTEEMSYYRKYQHGGGDMVFNMVSTFRKADKLLTIIGLDKHKKNDLLINFMNYYLNRYLYYNNLLELV